VGDFIRMVMTSLCRNFGPTTVGLVLFVSKETAKQTEDFFPLVLVMFSVGVRLSARRLAAAPRLANDSTILRAARPSVSSLSLLRSSFRPFSSQPDLQGEAPQYRETEKRDKVAGVGKRVVFLGSLPYRSTIDDVHEHVKDYNPTKIRLGASHSLLFSSIPQPCSLELFLYPRSRPEWQTSWLGYG
jgi:hypothetical protein